MIATGSPAPAGSGETTIVVLGRDECLRRLASSSVGRVAVNRPSGPPLIRPVSYVFDASSRAVVFRTARGTKLHALLGAGHAAFEVDSIDPASGTGWSVILSGVAEEITAPGELARLAEHGLQPLAPGEKPHWLRIRAFTVSGRRIGPAPAAESGQHAQTV